MIRTVFMGTPDFAVPVLDSLGTLADYAIAGVYTQPDKPAGRGRKLLASPVKEWAVAHHLPVFQPRTLRTPDPQAELSALHPDVIVVAAYGLILPRPVLDLPPFGCINVHASLLPKYRGAAPIQAAILSGEAVTGITLMRMDEGVDTGPSLAQAELAIRADDTSGSLAARLARLGADVLARTLPRWLAGQIELQAQDEKHATFALRLSKEEGRLDWSRPAAELERRVRAFEPWPGTFTAWNGKRLKISQVKISNLGYKTLAPALRSGPFGSAGVSDLRGPQPGQVLVWDGGVGVATGQGVLELLAVQLEGKRVTNAIDFVRGQPTFAGARLGD
jgi:methionyl-tRNA formyltransferase